MSYTYTADELLDPKSLTPEELYSLQSETWVQGYDHAIAKAVSILEDGLSELENCDRDDDCKKTAKILRQAIANIKDES